MWKWIHLVDVGSVKAENLKVTTQLLHIPTYAKLQVNYVDSTSIIHIRRDCVYLVHILKVY